MILLFDTAPMDGIGVRLLATEGEQHRALIGKDIDRIAAPGRDIDEPQCRRRTRTLVGRIHQCEREPFSFSHLVLLMPDHLRALGQPVDDEIDRARFDAGPQSLGGDSAFAQREVVCKNLDAGLGKLGQDG